MSDQKTLPTGDSVTRFLEKVTPKARREDGFFLQRLLEEITGEPAKMWGPSIVGFGKYRYTYESGRSGEWMRLGFSPRKTNLSLYILPEIEPFAPLLAQLGPHRTGVSCLYLKRLSEVDQSVLRKLLECAWKENLKRYPKNAS
jgi:hypothetical protein